MKKQIFTLTVNKQNTNDFLSLTSQFGQPAVRFSVCSNDRANDFVVASRDDLMRIAEFLQQRCEAEEQISSKGSSYEPTGMGLCVMEYSGNLLATYYGKSNHGIEEDVSDWNYESLQQRFPYQGAIYVLFELFDGSIARNVLLKIIQACIAMQARFVATGLSAHCRKMLLQDVADRSGYDRSVVSRATHDVRILTPGKTFTLDNNVTNLEKPSLFDPGCIQYGITVSRLETMEVIKSIIDDEDPAHPFGDEAIAKQMQAKGFQIARRTVAKYRDMMEIPSSHRQRGQKGE